ncbi:MAG: chemotaxis-specific protein-glutamate methyltransferase CheB [Alphaproteobacteria bacterium]|nr:chemotaxis-specific protein-glutamate methyltransferase CheB [Alphaproteobacteria bacterium]
MRIGIVNDVMLATAALKRVIAATPGCAVAWTAANGAEAVAKAATDPADLILMDLIMPVMDGVEATRRIMRESPCAILIVTSTVSGHLGQVYDAMALGALDAIQTPVLGLSGAIDGAKALQDKIAVIGKLIRRDARRAPLPAGPAATATGGPPVIAIGASTGGPQAIADVLQALPDDLPASIAIVQHVDSHFAPGLAEWLSRRCHKTVTTARAGDRLTAGRIVIAGGPDHLVIEPTGRLGYSPEPRDSSYKPSVDAFFTTLARRRMGGCGILLTGMGRDGADGLLALRRAGYHTIAQDQATSVVWGMPKAATEIDAAVDVLPLAEIGPRAVKAIKEFAG